MSRATASFVGLATVLGLTALTAWGAAPRIESDLEGRAEHALSALDGARVLVDGRDVVLRGGLSDEDRDRALLALRDLEGVRVARGIEVVRIPRLGLEDAGSTAVLDSVGGARQDALEAARDDLEMAVDSAAASRSQDQVAASGSEDADVRAAESALRDVLSAGAVTFSTATATLTTDSRALLDAVADVLERYPSVVVEVQGHTDGEGGERANRRLSQRRADAVAAYLIEAGVPDPTLRARGYGESEPIATNETERGRARNRRVVFAPGPR